MQLDALDEKSILVKQTGLLLTLTPKLQRSRFGGV
jgi:hypothetical protein